MTFNSFKSFPKSIENKIKSKEKIVPGVEIREGMRSWMEGVFKSQGPEKIIDEVTRRMELLFKYINRDILSGEQSIETRDSLHGCIAIGDKNQFVNEILQILKPIFDIASTHPFEFEEAGATANNEAEGFIGLNRLVAYEKIGGTIKIHHSMAKTVGPKLRIYYDAMRKLAKIIENDPEIQTIEAASWIVNEAPSLFTKKGFVVEKARKHISSFSKGFAWGQEKDEEGRPVSIATINRDEFLKVFGDNSDKK